MPENTPRIVIPTKNGQMVQFQVSKHLFFSSAPWKTTKKTCISIIRQIWKNSPEKGCFLALNVPGNTKQNFAKVCDSSFVFGTIASPLWLSFRKKTMDGSNAMWQKVSFLATLRHFGAFLAIKEPLGTQRESFSKIRECYISHHNVVTACKISENTMDSHWEFSGHTHARTRVNSKVPILTIAGGPKTL